MRLRKLRIAWSVACGVLCVLLIVLWVQSYSQPEMKFLRLTTNQGLRFSSDGGVAEVTYFDDAVKGFIPLELPYWAWLLVAAILAVVPWMRIRFSLRTLLIAATLLAVVLGLAIYAVRK
jgi:hypothetical protein